RRPRLGSSRNHDGPHGVNSRNDSDAGARRRASRRHGPDAHPRRAHPGSRTDAFLARDRPAHAGGRSLRRLEASLRRPTDAVKSPRGQGRTEQPRSTARRHCKKARAADYGMAERRRRRSEAWDATAIAIAMQYLPYARVSSVPNLIVDGARTDKT